MWQEKSLGTYCILFLTHARESGHNTIGGWGLVRWMNELIRTGEQIETVTNKFGLEQKLFQADQNWQRKLVHPCQKWSACACFVHAYCRSYWIQQQMSLARCKRTAGMRAGAPEELIGAQF